MQMADEEAEATAGIPDSTVLSLYHRAEDRSRNRKAELRLLARFIGAARRELEPHERKRLASTAIKAVAEAIRRVDDRAWRSTKSACRGCRYWSAAAIQAASEGRRVVGEHSPECVQLAQQIWTLELSVDEIYEILSNAEVIALTVSEKALVRRADPHHRPDLFANLAAGVSPIYCLDGSRPQRVWPN